MEPCYTFPRGKAREKCCSRPGNTTAKAANLLEAHRRRNRPCGLENTMRAR